MVRSNIYGKSNRSVHISYAPFPLDMASVCFNIYLVDLYSRTRPGTLRSDQNPDENKYHHRHVLIPGSSSLHSDMYYQRNIQKKGNY